MVLGARALRAVRVADAVSLAAVLMTARSARWHTVTVRCRRSAAAAAINCAGEGSFFRRQMGSVSVRRFLPLLAQTAINVASMA